MHRVAVITGASRGIGAATASAFAKRGFQVVVNYYDPSAQQAEEVVAAITEAAGEAVAIRPNVTTPADVAAMAEQTEKRWGRIDVLVHNALIPFDVTSFADLRWEQLGGKLERELHAAFLITKAVVPGMVSRHYGRLVCMSAGLSHRPREGMITLGTAKAALDQFVRYIALELAPHGITANLVAPATVAETKVTEKLATGQVRELGAANPMGRLVRPDEVAATVAFLASENSVLPPATIFPSTAALPWIETALRRDSLLPCTRSTWPMPGAASTRSSSPMLPTRRATTRMRVSTSLSAMGSAGKRSVCAAARRSDWAGACYRG
jgi:NAD(P)-dependent dehydrogenase (short-subunit alcohol dehydrogenase family)